MRKYNYWCKNRSDINSCEFCGTRGDLVIEEETTFKEQCDIEYKCPENSEVILKLQGESTVFTQSSNRPKMTGKEIKADRKKRNSAHFKREVLPTLSTSEKIHHKLKK